jgi:very-short-patch-repair endonuclease
VARSAGVVFVAEVVFVVNTRAACAFVVYMARIYSNLTSLKPIRRSLRSALTPAEIRLWQAVKGKKLAGRKFRRQHSIGHYVLDFFCPAECIAVELDGSAHDSAAANQRDERRDAFLSSLGIQVVRFENRHVMENLEGVLAEISSRFSR